MPVATILALASWPVATVPALALATVPGLALATLLPEDNGIFPLQEFGEVQFGLSYLPTAQRLSFSIVKVTWLLLATSY